MLKRIYTTCFFLWVFICTLFLLNYLWYFPIKGEAPLIALEKSISTFLFISFTISKTIVSIISFILVVFIPAIIFHLALFDIPDKIKEMKEKKKEKKNDRPRQFNPNNN
jgi:hypothetical protein